MAAASETRGLRPVQTANPLDTIWSKIAQDDFRSKVVALEKRTNAVPIDVLTAPAGGLDDKLTPNRCLPLRVEKQIADDLAYVAAVSEGAQSVAAVCVEQHVGSGERAAKLIVKVAGMDVVDDHVKNMLYEIAKVLQDMSRSASTFTTPDPSVSTEAIFRLVVQQHKQKLLGRLRSQKWTKPAYLGRTHKKSLWQDFSNVIHRVQHAYPKKSQRRIRETTTARLMDLAKIYEDFETTEIDTEQALRALVEDTYTFCKSPDIIRYAMILECVSSTPQISAALKTLRQLEKVGAYRRIAQDLIGAACRFPSSFGHIVTEYITPYSSFPTEITYESWAGKCHVHAEVQLVVEDALNAIARQHSSQTTTTSTNTSDTALTVIKPRTIGTSKYLCYLCYLFLYYHGGYELLSTHGRLYDQWTVPDLAEYDSATRQKFASVLEQMKRHVERRMEETEGVVWRAEPMTSRQNLLCCGDGDGDGDGDGVVEQVSEKLGKLDV